MRLRNDMPRETAEHPTASILCRSFAGEGLERERFAEHAAQSYAAGVGFAKAKANLESLNRHALFHCQKGYALSAVCKHKRDGPRAVRLINSCASIYQQYLLVRLSSAEDSNLSHTQPLPVITVSPHHAAVHSAELCMRVPRAGPRCTCRCWHCTGWGDFWCRAARCPCACCSAPSASPSRWCLRPRAACSPSPTCSARPSPSPGLSAPPSNRPHCFAPQEHAHKGTLRLIEIM